MKITPGFQMEEVSPVLVEEGVPKTSQTMGLDKVFWSHFSPNLVPAAWVIGTLLAALGLDFWTGLAVIVVGNMLGSLPVALAGLLGPQTRLTQIEISRFSFGKRGARVPAVLNWVACIGWDAVNNLASVAALVALFMLLHLDIPFWLILAVLVAIQTLVAIYGHHLVQVTEKYLGAFLLISFLVIGIVAVSNGGGILTTPTLPGWSTLVLAIAIIASFNLAWAPYSADYTRYLPADTPARSIFWRIFLGLGVSASLLELFGLMTAGIISDPTPGAVIGGIAHLTGWLAPFALFAIGISCIAVNAVNDNTGAYSLISAGIRIRRPISAVLASALGFTLALLGAGQFIQLYESFLLLLLYWVSPWVAIVLTHWYMNRRRFPQTYSPGWTLGATIFAVVTPLTIFLFASTPGYVGPIARLLDGTDVGYLVGFIAAAFLYALGRRL